ncbi:MAG TPA: glycosyl hydrolase family 65 protein [Prolixibacteraceae bacterium]|nr:glycosyl hydrolase family 65 protein [Prolixibacteraceae bacterium]
MKKIVFVLCLFFSINTFGQKLSCDNSLVKDAFTLAVQTVDINTRRGILAAGVDYGGEWTRDIAINSWNAASLLRPKVAEESLWSVTVKKDSVGHQYWDKIIWVIGAYNHYLITGDKDFLAKAYKCSALTMKGLEGYAFDQKYGLFKGGSVFNDGIAGYPEPIYEPGNFSSGVMDHKNSFQIKCLSTNSVYYGAYLALIKMGTILNESKEVISAYQKKADNLKASILKNLYNSDKNTFNYLVDQNGKVHEYQEALGISFAVIFGVIDGEKANQLIGNAVVSQYGITSIVPDFPRYSKEMPGRHNNLIWPFINGFFANAAITVNNYQTFSHELFGLTHLALDEDKGNYDFREIFNPNSGQPDGGYQAWGPERPNYHWDSCKEQTWSATAYISMVTKGVFGMLFSEGSLTFKPYLPEGITTIELKDLAYRNANLDITIKGKGKTIKSFTVDGKPQKNYSIASSTKGTHNVVIELQ